MRDLGPVYAAMQAERLHGNGLSLLDSVGGGDPRQVGEMTVALLRSFGLLRPGTRVLDLGCGCGRVTLSLIEALGPQAHYVGTDIIPEMIAFCRREIAPHWPGLEFYCVDEANPGYDPWIQPASRSADLLLKDERSLEGRFDLVIASSVFTHLDEAGARDMLKRVRAWLAPGGSALLSFYLLDRWSRRRISQGQAQLFNGAGPWRAKWAKEINVRRNQAVAFDQGLVEAMALAAGFPGLRALSHGDWRGIRSPHQQDYIVLQREIPIPDEFDAARYLELHPDVAQAGMDAHEHWLKHGKREGRAWR